MLQGNVSASNTLFELYLITYALKGRAVGDGGDILDTIIYQGKNTSNWLKTMFSLMKLKCIIEGLI